MNIKKLDPSTSPRAAFGDHLRRSRIERGWTQDQLGERLGCSGTHISGIETAAKFPAPKYAVRADKVFGTGLTFQILWGAIKNRSLLTGFSSYLAEEAKAIEIRMFELDVIPGPLQTPDYAAALADAEVQRGTIDEQQAQERLDLLLARQDRLLKGPNAPYLHVVLNEGCLRRMVGGVEVMSSQFRYLEDVAVLPKVTLQVAPFSMGARRPFAAPVILLTLADRSLVGCTESQAESYLSHGTDMVASWARDYDRLQVGALSDVESLAMIRAARKDLDACQH
ncbi:helix-turn-helix domain-containing protein [Kitasatospora viridis]|uniref:DNA-binding XRE family transcriptional regulator n=1 Tax=Kitasatospora viridis TaxID=281105 RepID=A0A561T6Z4_9ACTN|nr:helix-turn-helix transcriptional regulator [Kitasatospora viridis]TWF82870.1 DNA-binding XRE family transcriptional regulator [Kitasatospora viridis]